MTSRTASAQRAIVRLRTLYAAATKVSDVIAIEDELSQRESDLESLQAQARTLSAQTTLATITLTLEVAPATPSRTHHRHGFLGGLVAGWHAFGTGASRAATAAGAAVPFVLLLLLLAVAVRLSGPWRARRRGRVGPPAPSPGE